MLVDAKARQLGVKPERLLELIADRVVSDDCSVEHDIYAILIELTEKGIKNKWL
ncbi:hypothetical protein ACOMICROBIO_GDFFDHBD_00101 [Vibrio sp. B1REV9]|uniref:hypothetical protein n=1 Tax=Vibrio sp. B1REV9 TaxID=2751179 RepID=UPI001AF5BFFE|nr:hypothetical protein [Vibrio sp. B1REV9]CAE6878973.1 hypothetical protein ACOMICROBIO_GDFFDHBD_00101 [Vibrio sp. B1REV9]